MASHTVVQGECFISIAAKYGFGSKWKDLYDHEENADLKEKRTDPFCLMPGDIVNIPEGVDSYTDPIKVKKGQKHTFIIHRPKALLILKMIDIKNEPIADAPYELHIDEKIIKGNTDGDGKIEEEILADAEEAKILFWPNPEIPELVRNYEVEIGHLDPIEEVSGQQGRLINQGFPLEKVDNVAGDKTNEAIASIEYDRQLKDEAGEEITPLADSLLRNEQ